MKVKRCYAVMTYNTRVMIMVTCSRMHLSHSLSPLSHTCTHSTAHHRSDSQQEYIAWQSRFIYMYLINNTKLTAFFISAWDLLRVEYFFKAHPHNFVSPLRVSGSAVETLFSPYKYAAGGKLDSSNYATARAACLVKSAVAQSQRCHPTHPSTHISEEKV